MPSVRSGDRARHSRSSLVTKFANRRTIIDRANWPSAWPISRARSTTTVLFYIGRADALRGWIKCGRWSQRSAHRSASPANPGRHSRGFATRSRAAIRAGWKTLMPSGKSFREIVRFPASVRDNHRRQCIGPPRAIELTKRSTYNVAATVSRLV